MFDRISLGDSVSSSRRNDSPSSDFRSRYWTFLFDNLKRSIEQIYQTCESDQNPNQCHVRQRVCFSYLRFISICRCYLQEVTQYLNQCSKDFDMLKKTFQHLQNLDDEIDGKNR